MMRLRVEFLNGRDYRPLRGPQRDGLLAMH